MQSNKKGQAAIEFYVFLGAFLVVLGVVGFTFLNYASAESARREAELAHEIGGEYADMVNFALVAGDGFNGMFYPTKKIRGMDYNATFGNPSTGETSGFVIISGNGTRGEYAYLYPLNTRNITGDLVIQSTAINDYVLVKNQNDSIYIEVH